MTERADPVGLLPRSGVGRAALLAVLWTVVGVIFALPNIGSPGGAVLALVFSLTQWWAWGLVAPLVVAADRRLPFSDRQLARRLAAHLALSLAFTVLYVYLSAALRAARSSPRGRPSSPRRSSPTPWAACISGAGWSTG